MFNIEITIQKNSFFCKNSNIKDIFQVVIKKQNYKQISNIQAFFKKKLGYQPIKTVNTPKFSRKQLLIKAQKLSYF
jgi:hypothetical protein